MLAVDTTGVGAGLASFLADQLGRGPRRVIVSPFLFNQEDEIRSRWAFLGLIGAGRLKEYADDGSDITRIYRHQLAACTFEVLPGPGKLLRCSVLASRGHDDLLISTALTAWLDAMDWRDRTARGSRHDTYVDQACRCPFRICLSFLASGYSAFDDPFATGAVKAFGIAIPIAILGGLIGLLVGSVPAAVLAECA